LRLAWRVRQFALFATMFPFGGMRAYPPLLLLLVGIVASERVVPHAPDAPLPGHTEHAVPLKRPTCTANLVGRDDAAGAATAGPQAMMYFGDGRMPKRGAEGHTGDDVAAGPPRGKKAHASGQGEDGTCAVEAMLDFRAGRMPKRGAEGHTGDDVAAGPPRAKKAHVLRQGEDGGTCAVEAEGPRAAALMVQISGREDGRQSGPTAVVEGGEGRCYAGNMVKLRFRSAAMAAGPQALNQPVEGKSPRHSASWSVASASDMLARLRAAAGLDETNSPRHSASWSLASASDEPDEEDEAKTTSPESEEEETYWKKYYRIILGCGAILCCCLFCVLTVGFIYYFPH